MPIAIGKPYVLRKPDPACCDLQVTSHQSHEFTIWLRPALMPPPDPVTDAVAGAAAVSAGGASGFWPTSAFSPVAGARSFQPGIAVTSSPIWRQYLPTRWYIRSPTP